MLQLKGSSKPIETVKYVAKILCIMFDNVPKIGKKQEELGAYWDHFQSHILTPEFRQLIKDYPE